MPIREPTPKSSAVRRGPANERLARAVAELASEVEATAGHCNHTTLDAILRIASVRDAASAAAASLLAEEITRQLATLEVEVGRFVRTARLT